jgi:redox-sensitive bicupin YhaK (pirin superfamily)
MTARTVARVYPSIETLEGGGFLVRRPFPTAGLDQIDPFLLLDEMGPMDVGPGEAKGAPDHPHRGFETVTYLLSGGMEHRDSRGNSGSIGPGDVQWMTAGSGVVHSEMPDAEILRRGGRMHGFQLWVNLPARDKKMAPRYQEVKADRIPEATTPDGRVIVRVLAGEALGIRARIDTRTPIEYLDCRLKPGASFEKPLSDGDNAFAYVVDGSGVFGKDSIPAKDGELVLFANDGDAALLKADPGTNLSALLIAGTPLREPVARYGPFVMNTRSEILEAAEDFRRGRLG